MPLYKYKIVSKDGKPSEFIIEGDNEKDSLARLRARGFVPLQFCGLTDSTGTKSAKSFGLFSKSTFNANEFTNRLVPLLKAHIQLEKALGILIEGTEDKESKEIIANIRRGLHEGKKMSELIKSSGKAFPPIYANLVEAGEETGSLPEVMLELQNFLNYRKEMKDFLVTSSIYPIIILIVTFAVILLLFTVFIPRFAKIFLNMGKPLPLPTKILLDVSNITLELWWLWVILIALLAFFITKVRQGGKTRDWWDAHIIRVKLLGEIIATSEIDRFIKTLAVLIRNNVHLITAVRISSKVVQNRSISNSLVHINNELRGGKKLSKALAKSPYLPKIVIQMLEIGEESGSMGEMLQDVAENLEKSMRSKVKKLLGLFEPVVILFLALVVLIVVISIFLAIIEMNNI